MIVSASCRATGSLWFAGHTVVPYLDHRPKKAVHRGKHSCTARKHPSQQVRSGGLVVGHDFSPFHLTVILAVPPTPRRPPQMSRFENV